MSFGVQEHIYVFLMHVNLSTQLMLHWDMSLKTK